MKRELITQVQEILELQSGLLRELSKLLPRLLEENEENERLLPIKEASARLGVAESTLRRLIAQGEVKSAKIGGKVVVPESEIRRLANAK